MHAANPYHPTADGPYVPSAFAGRTDAYSKINQHLTDTTAPQAATITGRRRVGKSALLWHFREFFPATYLSVYVPLREVLPDDEAALVALLAEGIQAVLAAQPRPPGAAQPEVEVPVTLGVFADDFLPVALKALRGPQRLVLLLDDVEVLVEGMNTGQLPANLFATFSTWIGAHERLGMVVTLCDTAGDAALAALTPLADQAAVYRLGALMPEEHALLLRIPEEYTLTDEAVEAAYRATGGDPLLAQRLGHALYELGYTSITADTVRGVLPGIVNAHHEAFRAAWGELTLNERLVLTALSGLIYREPLAPVTPERLNRWLASHGYPLDSTATRAALRGIEYAGMARITHEGVTVAAGLLQTWLLQHAQLDAEATTTDERQALWRTLLIGLGIVLLVILATLAGREIAGGRGSTITDPPLPTVTLEAPA